MSDQHSDAPATGQPGGRRPSGAPRGTRRGRRAETRRKELIRTLHSAGEPVRGSDLAAHFGVSRQVVVQDVALLRAAGADIIATPRGYLLRSPGPQGHRDVLHVRHGRADIVDELTVLVDLGIRVLDVTIEHPIFGVLRAALDISSRHDVQELVVRLAATGSAPLLELTNGRHSHTVESPRPDLLDRAREELKSRGYLNA